MSPELLHQHLKQSLRDVVAADYAMGFRALLESGSAEQFLTDLLFVTLHAAGHTISCEFPIGKRRAADLVLHESTRIFLEAKQLHLMDGCKYAPSNLSKDLERHSGQTHLGIIYVLDERASALPRQFERFGGKNRKAEVGLDQIALGLKNTFTLVLPTSADAARLRTFDGHGQLDVYGFIVAEPIPRP